MRAASCMLLVAMCVACDAEQIDDLPDTAVDAVGPVDGKATPLRRLTRLEYERTVRDLLGQSPNVAAFVADDKSGLFDANVGAVSVLQVERYAEAAQRLAEAVNVPQLTGCPPDRACIEEWLQHFGRRAYRRPLEPEETSELLAVYDAVSSDGGFESGVARMLEAMLQSAPFLYIDERGTPDPRDPRVHRLDGYEVATRLAYFLWKSMPDTLLLDAAAAGLLDDAEGVRRQAERLLADPRADAAIGSFHLQWLQLDILPTEEKDPGVHPEFDASLVEAMLNETSRFATYVVREGDGRLTTLLTAPFSLLTEPLFPLYGLQLPPNFDATIPVGLPSDRRAGLLTQPAFLATHAHRDQTSPVKRGGIIRQNLFCQPLVPPPPGVNNAPPEVDPSASTRERFAAHTADPHCAGCHKSMDPMGWGLENFDAIGRYRSTEANAPIDASGEIIQADVAGPFEGFLELTSRLSSSDDVRDCVARQWFRFALVRPEDDFDGPELSGLTMRFAESEGQVRELLVEIAASEAFRTRRNVSFATSTEEGEGR